LTAKKDAKHVNIIQHRTLNDWRRTHEKHWQLFLDRGLVSWRRTIPINKTQIWGKVKRICMTCFEVHFLVFWSVTINPRRNNVRWACPVSR
jgi:hypothetical protein